MADTKKLAESLKILNAQAENLLVSIYNGMHFLDPVKNSYMDSMINDQTERTATPKGEQPKLFADTALQNIVKAFTKKFPEYPDMTKVQGYQVMMSENKLILEELRPFYLTFIDVMDFTELTVPVLIACEKVDGLNVVQHHLITNTFLSLLSKFAYIHLLLGDYGIQRQAIAAGYNYLYAQERSVNEQNYSRLCKFLTDYDKPLVHLTEIFAGIGPYISSLLQSFSSEFTRWGFMPAEMVRKETSFNITANVKGNAMDDKRYRLLPVFNEYSTQILLCCLCIPFELLKQQSCMELLKSCIQQNICTVGFRSEIINAFEKIDALAKSNSKFSKLKAVVTENFGTHILRAVNFHKSRREYLRFALGQTLTLCQDRSFLLGPKLPAIESLLAFCQSEIIWYFNHLDKTIASKVPRMTPKPPHVLQAIDLGVIDLLAMMISIKELILSKKTYIQEYYSNMFQTHYHGQMELIIAELLRTNAPSDAVTKCFQLITEQLQSASPSSDFEGVRLNFARMLVHFHSSDTTVAVSTVPDFINLMNEIELRSKYIDSLENVMEKCCSFKELYYYRPLMVEHYQSAIFEYAPQIRNIYVFAKISQEFMKNVIPFYPKEFDRVGQRSVAFAEDFFGFFATKTTFFLHTVAAFHVSHDQQVFAEQGANFVPDRREKKAKKDKEKPFYKPGFETNMKYYTPSTNLSVYKRSMNCALEAWSDLKSFAVHDVEFSPDEYLKDSVALKLKAFLLTNLEESATMENPVQIADDGPYNIKRPSIYLAELRSYISFLMYLDECGPIDFHALVADVLLEQVDLANSRKLLADMESQSSMGAKKKKVKAGPTTNVNLTFTILITNWYYDFFKDKMANSVISPLRKSIVSPVTAPVAAHLFTNPVELTAFVELVGPSGVRLFDEKLVQLASSFVKDIKDILVNNEEQIQVLQKSWHVEFKFEENSKKIKQLDEFIRLSIQLGFVLQFRKLIFESLQTVLDRNSSLLFQCVKQAHKKYPPNIYSVPDYLSLDNIANYCGINDHVDTNFRSAMQSHCRSPQTDNKIYIMLPMMFALALKQLAEDKESVYLANLDVMQNNSHCIAEAIYMLLTYLISITAPNDMEGLVQIQREFLAISSTLLLRAKEKENNFDSLKSVYLILLFFVRASASSGGILSEDILEEYIPYIIFRQSYSDAFKKLEITKKLALSAEEATAQKEIY